MTTTWRSPLGILMGARRNDDDDLELRDDYYHPTRSNNNNTPMPATPNQQAYVNQTPASTKSGITSYLPFSYFGLKSPAPTPAKDNKYYNNVNISQDNMSPIPPQRSFPPHISEVSQQQDIIDSSGHSQKDRQNSNESQQYSASHPWFNQLELTIDEGNDDDNSYNNNNNVHESKEKKQYITWSDKRAIIGTTFNFTNSIIGAGAMGLGGAFAASGGLISILMLCTFAYLMKQSLDLIVDLSSCPEVIALARLRNNSEHDDRDDESIEIDFQQHVEEDVEEEDVVSFADSNEDNDIFMANERYEAEKKIDESKDNDDGNDQSKNLDLLSPATNYIGEVNGVVATTTSPDEKDNKEIQEKSSPDTGDSSPLMAKEEDDDGQDTGFREDENFKTPLKNTGLEIGHKLNEGEGLLTMNVTEPRDFSPLNHLNNNADRTTPKRVGIENTKLLKRYDDPIQPCTYEELGRAAFGANGRLAVLLSKSLYSFGCLVAYVVVVRDNFGPALRRIVIGDTSPSNTFTGTESDNSWIYDDNFLAFWISALFMLPLSCPRTMKPLAKFSFISILSIIFLVLVVIYLYFTCTNPEGGTNQSSFDDNWIEIRSLTGFVESLGCFVFTFVCHHTVNLAYESLPPPIRTPRIWRRVSTNSIALALQSSLALGIFAYLTFGTQTPADVLMGYPETLTLANIARLLLCLTMVLTFPLPFLTCREMSILVFVDAHAFYYKHNLQRYNMCSPMIDTTVAVFSAIWEQMKQKQRSKRQRRDINDESSFVQMQRPSFWGRFGSNVGTGDDWYDEHGEGGDITQALLSEEDDERGVIRNIGGDRGKEINPSPLSSRSGSFGSDETTISSVVVPTPSWLLKDGDGRQLTFLWHTILTFTLWFIVTICAIKSPSLGDVLDLVGAGTGTLLAFILPALFSFKLKGYSRVSMAILSIGGVVGILGTIFSCVKFTRDALGS